MKTVIIEDDTEARALAEKYGYAEDMLTSARIRTANAIRGDVGIMIGKKHGEVSDSGTFEFLFFSLFTNFLHGQNGWAVHGWTDVDWAELPYVVQKMMEMELRLPEILGNASALEKLKKKGLEEL